MWRIHLCLALVVLLGAPPLRAQEAVRVVHLSGTVLDEQTGAPIPGALVEVMDGRSTRLARTLADDDGGFRFALRPEPEYRFRAARIGYRRAVTPLLRTEGRDTVTVAIRLHPEAVLLAPLEVTAWSPRVRPSPVLEGFRERMRSGIGYFLTHDDVERRRPALISDLLATIPGVHLQSSGRGTQRKIYMSRSSNRCLAQIYVDGFLLNGRSRFTGDPDFSLDDAVQPGSVEGVEVYSGLSTVPPQFLNPDSRCGVVAVWTRRGDRP